MVLLTNRSLCPVVKCFFLGLKLLIALEALATGSVILRLINMSMSGIERYAKTTVRRNIMSVKAMRRKAETRYTKTTSMKNMPV